MISAEYDPEDHSVTVSDGDSYVGTLYGIHSISALIVNREKNVSGVMFKDSVGLVVMMMECVISKTPTRPLIVKPIQDVPGTTKPFKSEEGQ